MPGGDVVEMRGRDHSDPELDAHLKECDMYRKYVDSELGHLRTAIGDVRSKLDRMDMRVWAIVAGVAATAVITLVNLILTHVFK